MSDFAFTKGPYSVHPYSAVQGKRTLASDGETYEVASITIGAGRKMLGEVTYCSKGLGYPRIDSEAEMRAVAALWIAAPALAEALRALQLQALQSPELLRTAYGQEAIAGARAALALLDPTPANEVAL